MCKQKEPPTPILSSDESNRNELRSKLKRGRSDSHYSISSGLAERAAKRAMKSTSFKLDLTTRAFIPEHGRRVSVFSSFVFST